MDPGIWMQKKRFPEEFPLTQSESIVFGFLVVACNIVWFILWKSSFFLINCMIQRYTCEIVQIYVFNVIQACVLVLGRRCSFYAIILFRYKAPLFPEKNNSYHKTSHHTSRFRLHPVNKAFGLRSAAGTSGGGSLKQWVNESKKNVEDWTTISMKSWLPAQQTMGCPYIYYISLFNGNIVYGFHAQVR